MSCFFNDILSVLKKLDLTLSSIIFEDMKIKSNHFRCLCVCVCGVREVLCPYFCADNINGSKDTAIENGSIFFV